MSIQSMIQRTKAAIRIHFPFLKPVYSRIYSFVSKIHWQIFVRPRLQRMDPESVFRWYYEKKDWAGSGAESVSGPGSTIHATKYLQTGLPELILEYGIKSFLDIPCGDGNWISQIDLGLERYIGADIVQELVDLNIKDNKKGPAQEFFKLDLILDPLPKVDMIFCRDCLVHLSNEHVLKALKNIKTSGSTYLLTTTFPENLENTDIVTGGWRPINLQCHPFDLPEPVKIMQADGIDSVQWNQSLGLWCIGELIPLQ